MAGCSIRGAVHKLFGCLLFSNISKLQIASLLLCRIHTIIFKYNIQLIVCVRE